MRKKAEAWQQYQEAAMVDMVLKTLPHVSSNRTLLKIFTHEKQEVLTFTLDCCRDCRPTCFYQQGKLTFVSFF